MTQIMPQDPSQKGLDLLLGSKKKQASQPGRNAQQYLQQVGLLSSGLFPNQIDLSILCLSSAASGNGILTILTKMTAKSWVQGRYPLQGFLYILCTVVRSISVAVPYSGQTVAKVHLRLF